MKISLYRFITTFCLVPVNDWVAFGQRLLSFAQRLLIIKFFFTIGKVLFETFKTPAYLAVIVAILTYFPDSVKWIFLKIGEIQIKCFSIMLNVIMPDIFATAGDSYSTAGDLWQAGLNALPSDVLDIMNAVGVAELLGIVTTCLMSGWIVRIYRRVMLRAGLL